MTRSLRLAVLPAVFALAALAAMGGPAAGVTVSVAPAETTVTVGNDFVLRVVTDAFPDLKAYHLVHSFDSAIINCLGVDPGDVLTSTLRSFTSYPDPDNSLPTGTILYDAAMLTGATAGPGILGFYRFHAVAEGDTPLQCVEVDFRDPLNNQTLPDCVSGLVHVRGPVPASPTTWGRLKTLYR
jgi:hypothetical protein